MADLKAGDVFAGRVVNVASFGAFVEIAQGVTGLLHISRLGDRFVRDPRELVMPGETIPVWIVSVDREKQRIALSIHSAQIFQAAAREARGSWTAHTAQIAWANRKPAIPQDRIQTSPATQAQAGRAHHRRNEVGSEPMRTFGDLKQFFDISQDSDTPKQKSPAQKPVAKKPAAKKPTEERPPRKAQPRKAQPRQDQPSKSNRGRINGGKSNRRYNGHGSPRCRRQRARGR